MTYIRVKKLLSKLIFYLFRLLPFLHRLFFAHECTHLRKHGSTVRVTSAHLFLPLRRLWCRRLPLHELWRPGQRVASQHLRAGVERYDVTVLGSKASRHLKAAWKPHSRNALMSKIWNNGAEFEDSVQYQRASSDARAGRWAKRHVTAVTTIIKEAYPK